MKGKAVAQYDVHLNPGPMQASVPMVVLVQSSLFDDYRRRVVVPLVLHPLDMVSVAMDRLGPCVANLSEQGQAIADALDELLTRSWG